MASSVDPESVDAHLQRGYAYGVGGEIEQAIDEFGVVIRFGSPDRRADAYINRGIAKFKKKSDDEAIDDFTEAINQDENAAEAYANRGYLYGKTNRFDTAIEDFKSLLEIVDIPYKLLIIAYINIGIIQLKLNRVDLAIEEFSRAIELDSRHAEDDYLRGIAHEKRGVAYLNKDKLIQAIDDFNAAISLETRLENSAEYFVNRGITYFKLNKFDKAIGDFPESSNSRRSIATPTSTAAWPIGRKEWSVKSLRIGPRPSRAIRSGMAISSATTVCIKDCKLSQLSLARSRSTHSAPLARPGPPRSPGEPTQDVEALDSRDFRRASNQPGSSSTHRSITTSLGPVQTTSSPGLEECRSRP